VVSDQDGFYLVAKSVLSTNDEALDGFTMHPNPAGEQLQISTTNEPMSQIAIYSMLGKQILNVQVNNQTTATLDISGLTQGVYVVIIDNKTTKKLIKY